MYNITVIKRNGKREPLDISKIKKQIEFVCKDTDIDPIVFERELRLVITDGIKTSDIQETIINTARRLASNTNPEWIKVAGKAKMWDIYGRVYKNTGFNLNNWKEHIQWLIDKGYYKKEILDKLNKFNIEDDFIDMGVITNIGKDNKDFDTCYSRAALLVKGYLISDINNEPIEYPILMDIANALLLAESRESFDKIFYYLHNRYFVLATPFLRNLRRPNGNLGSCFIGEGADSLASLFKSYTDIAFISKNGGGIGWYLGKIRPGDTVTDNIKKANKITKWIKIMNDIVIAVNQAGIRKGALTVALDWWHMDIIEFSEVNREDNGELREKSFDIFPQVVLDKWFIDKVKKDENVYLFNQYEYKKLTGKDITELIDEELWKAHEEVEELIETGKLKHYKSIRARELLKHFMDSWIAVGKFYITHKDNLNKSNYLKYDPDGGITKSANLCVESFSLTKVATKWKEEVVNSERNITETNGMYHSCNLSSLNLAKFVELDDDEIASVVYWAIYALDRSIDLTTAPVLEAKKGSESLRNVGLGVIGLADYLAYNKVPYHTDEGIKLAQGLIEKIAYYSYKASIDLATKKGSYPLYKSKNYERGLFGYTYEELDNISKKETGNNIKWSELKDLIQTNGIRNFLLLALAPNTSTSLLICATASYQPPHDKFFVETKEGITTEVAPPFLKDRYWFYRGKHTYTVRDIIKMTRAIQKFVDTGISLELVINPDIDNSFTDIINPIIDGFDKGEIKAIYYSRTLSKDSKNDKKDSSHECVDCAN